MVYVPAGEAEEAMSERTWKRRLWRRSRMGVYEWHGWTMPVFRIGLWELRLDRWTHQAPRERTPWIE